MPDDAKRIDDEEGFDIPDRPGAPNFVTTDEKFRRAVQVGIESARTQPLVSFEDVKASMQRIIDRYR